MTITAISRYWKLTPYQALCKALYLQDLIPSSLPLWRRCDYHPRFTEETTGVRMALLTYPWSHDGKLEFILVKSRWWFSLFSHVRLFMTPWTVAHQAPLSMEFSRQEYWSELPFPSPGDLPNSGIEPSCQLKEWTWVSCTAGRFFTNWA